MKVLKKIVVVCVLFCLHTACEGDFTSTIPNAPVYLTVDLYDYNLTLPPSYKEFITKKDASFPLDTYRFGFGGILLVNGFGERPVNLYAYDLACPNEAQRDIRVKPQDSGLHAVCPECKAVYNTATGGAPASGSKYWLRRYNVVEIGYKSYRITN